MNFFGCPVCCEKFNATQHIPRIFKCGHTFCQKCINSMLGNNYISCPTCRCFFPPDIANLAKNYMLLDYSELGTGLQKVKPCVEHLECVSQFYCISDKKQICYKCIGSSHLGHKIVSIQQLKEDGVKREEEKSQDFGLPAGLEILQRKIQIAINETDTISSEFEEVEFDLNKTKENVKNQVEQKFEILNLMLRNRKDELLQQAQLFSKNQQLVLLESKKKTVTHKKQLEDLQEKCHKLFVNYKDNREFNKQKALMISQQLSQFNKSFQLNLNSFKSSSCQEGFETIGALKYPVYQPSPALRNATVSEDGVAQENQKVFMFGDPLNSVILEYSFATDIWISKPVPQNFSFYLYRAGTCLSPTKSILLSGGLELTLSVVTDSTQLFDPEENSVQEMASLKTPRYTHSQTLLNSKVYAVGGRGNPGVLNSCERFCISKNSWQNISNMRIQRCTVPVIPYNNRYIYVLGGYEGKGRLSTIERYDETKEQWELLPIKLPHPMEAHSATYISNSQVILCGGYDGIRGMGTLISFDLEKMDFNEFKNLNIEVHLHGTFKNGEYLYIVGGEQSSECCWKVSLKTLELHEVKSYAEFASCNVESFVKVGV